MNLEAVLFATILFMLVSDESFAWILPQNARSIPAATRLYAKKTHPVRVDVCPVDTRSSQDVMDLADMRYREWIQDDGTDQNTPSLGAFRMATAEILQERTQEGAMTFLARIPSKDSSMTVVGSAELSPIEVRGLTPPSLSETESKWLYVTDVVTSSSHRRLGVGTALMDAMEREAALQLNATRIYLHVCTDNTGAIEFYCKRGYLEAKTSDDQVDTEKLAEAAGAIGQMLLQKELILGEMQENDPARQRKQVGFGKQKQGGKKGFGKQKRAAR